MKAQEAGYKIELDMSVTADHIAEGIINRNGRLVLK
jgi:hypothetical protein